MPISWEIAFVPRVLKISDFGQFWPVFITEVWHAWITRNTYQIWLKMVLFDGVFIEGFVKTSKNQRLLAKK